MIVWFNCKISDIRLSHQNRFNLDNPSRVDVAKYSFASFEPLIPLTSKFIFNLEMADAHKDQQQEMQEWLESIFPADKLIMNWYRCDNLAQWNEMRELINSIDDDLIFPAGNEDHIFLDSNIEVFKNCLDFVKNSDAYNTVFGTSHWPESIRSASYYNASVYKNKNCAMFPMQNNDALRVMKKEFFNWYIDQIKDPNMLIFRTENWNSVVLPMNNIVVPMKEQFRHFDGYSHVNVDPNIVAPLTIPPGFFQNSITVKYGFDDLDPTCVNINPIKQNLFAVSKSDSTDYKWCLEDIPAFWQSRIKDTIVNENVEHDVLREERDKHLLLSTRVKIDWPHFNITFDESNYPPADWINDYTLALEFNDD